ncbi:MAG: ABC transporter ATP-binding protein, partial [Pseudonocardiaceae bacterium]|nr:ABC transporter ATP-binding protein [Pseudonocardiaceae bacterium]
LALEKETVPPALPPIPLQLEPSSGQRRATQHEPGEWCRLNGVTPPPGSFAPDMVMTPGARV